MNANPPQHRLVGVGLYSVSEASRLTRIDARSIRRWLKGYDYVAKGEPRHSPPLWQPDLDDADDGLEITFRDLIELRFIGAFVDLGLSLQTIRACLELARDCFHSDRPFSTGRFRTDGKRLFLQGDIVGDDPVLIDLKKRQYVFNEVVQRTFKDLDLNEDVVARWRPFRGKESIVIDPKRSFGQPIASAFGVPTVVLADAFKAEQSLARVAAIYEVDRSVVSDAVKFHEELAAA